MNTHIRKATAFQVIRLALVAGLSLAIQAEVSAQIIGRPRTLEGQDAFGDWRDDAPGVRRHITLDDLPGVSKSVPNEVTVVPMPEDARPKVPRGFEVELVASGLKSPRAIRVAPNGDLFIANSKANEVRVLRMPPEGGRPTHQEVFAAGLSKPYGIAFYPAENPQWVYVGNDDGIVRFPYRTGDLRASSAPEQIVGRIPWTHHWTRDIVFTPDGERLLLTVGSGSNVALDMSAKPMDEGGLEAWMKNRPLGAAWDTEERRATILSFTPDGKDEKILATGLRNPSGIAYQPRTGALWAVVNERDGLGDDTPFEYATAVQGGAFYGWPWYYMGDNEDPRHKGDRRDLKGKMTNPDVYIQAHSSPLQITFYEGDQFPDEYRGSAFVTLHGSWDRSKRTGYKVIRLLFDQAGKPTGEYEDFMTGFVISDKEVWGRPVGVAVGKDGSLYVTEDGSGTIWRVSRRRDARDQR